MWQTHVEESNNNWMEFDIEKCAMRKLISGKKTLRKKQNCTLQKETEDFGKNKITSAWEYWKRIPSLKQRSKKKKEENFRRRRKLLVTKHYRRNHFEEKNHLGGFLYNILLTILKMDKGGTENNEPNYKKVNYAAQDLTFKRWHRLYMLRKKRRNTTPHHWVLCRYINIRIILAE